MFFDNIVPTTDYLYLHVDHNFINVYENKLFDSDKQPLIITDQLELNRCISNQEFSYLTDLFYP